MSTSRPNAVNTVVIDTDAIHHVLALFGEVLELRATFFDPGDRELLDFDVRHRSPYCRSLRQRPEMDRACMRCDDANIRRARRLRDIHLYRCHRGLWEAIVPLYSAHGDYLGCLFCGQLRPPDGVPPDRSATLQRLYFELPVATEQRLRKIASLLRYISQYVIDHQIVRRRAPDWADLAEKYVASHLDRRMTLADLARAVRKSPSFVSHHFPQQFGMSPMRYVRERKLHRAMELLRDGLKVRQVAARLAFYDEFHFSKAFKRAFGYPPKAARRSDR